MHRIENLYPHYKDQIKIEWNIGKRCNYNCSYCPKFIHDNFSKHTPIDKLKLAAKTIKLLSNPRISFTGGEPCIHPKFVELLDYLRPSVNWINVTTNGTLPEKFYMNITNNFLDHIIFSLHFEYNWQKILTRIISISKNLVDTKLLVHVMCLPGKLKDIKYVCNLLKNENINYILRPIRWTDTHDIFIDLEKYNKDELNFLRSENQNPPLNTIIDKKYKVNVNDFLINKTNQFEGWTCMAGLESLMINWDGKVYRATCRVGGELGNIYENTFNIPTSPTICTRKWCTCAADINTTKFSSY